MLSNRVEIQTISSEVNICKIPPSVCGHRAVAGTSVEYLCKLCFVVISTEVLVAVPLSKLLTAQWARIPNVWGAVMATVYKLSCPCMDNRL